MVSRSWVLSTQLTTAVKVPSLPVPHHLGHGWNFQIVSTAIESSMLRYLSLLAPRCSSQTLPLWTCGHIAYLRVLSISASSVVLGLPLRAARQWLSVPLLRGEAAKRYKHVDNVKLRLTGRLQMASSDGRPLCSCMERSLSASQGLIQNGLDNSGSSLVIGRLRTEAQLASHKPKTPQPRGQPPPA